MMGCISAAGEWIPPMYIFAGENMKKEWLDEAVNGSTCAMTKSSNVNGNVFFHWIKFFVGKIGLARPQILIMDGHYSHLSQRSVGFAFANDIKLFLLPSHTSHFLQPLDVGVFGDYKREYELAVAAFPASKGLADAALPVRDDVPALSRVPFLRSFTRTRIRGAFFKTGIYPFDVDIMLKKMMGSLSSSHKQHLPHHAALETSGIDLYLTGTQKKQLKRQGLDLDAFRLVAHHAKTVAMPQEKPRPHGTVVTPNMTEGVLLTSQDMVDVINMNAELNAMRLEDAASRRLRRFNQREKTAKAKVIKQVAAARELKERRAMRGEDAAARWVRSFNKREAAKQRTAEKQQAVRLEKAAVLAVRKRLKQSSDSSEQRKRRALGDITNECLI